MWFQSGKKANRSQLMHLRSNSNKNKQTKKIPFQSLLSAHVLRILCLNIKEKRTMLFFRHTNVVMLIWKKKLSKDSTTHHKNRSQPALLLSYAIMWYILLICTEDLLCLSVSGDISSRRKNETNCIVISISGGLWLCLGGILTSDQFFMKT